MVGSTSGTRTESTGVTVVSRPPRAGTPAVPRGEAAAVRQILLRVSRSHPEPSIRGPRRRAVRVSASPERRRRRLRHGVPARALRGAWGDDPGPRGQQARARAVADRRQHHALQPRAGRPPAGPLRPVPVHRGGRAPTGQDRRDARPWAHRAERRRGVHGSDARPGRRSPHQPAPQVVLVVALRRRGLRAQRARRAPPLGDRGGPLARLVDP
jgi:hypothetical protein